MNNFEIKETEDGRYYFVIKSSSGQVLMTSFKYSNRLTAENGIVNAKMAIREAE